MNRNRSGVLPAILLLLLVLAVPAIALILLAFSAPARPSTPTVVPMTGEVSIDTPQSGTIVYAPTLYLTGTASGLPAAGFRLLIVSAEDKTISDTTVVPTADTWSLEVANPVTDTPVEITISALPVDTTVLGDYDVESAVLSSAALRPEGVFGTITAPFDNDETGGDVIPVYGTASGLFEGTLNLALEQPDGTSITEQVLTVNNPGMQDEVPWSAELATNAYRGQAVIRAYYLSAKDGAKVTLDTVTVNVGDAAG